MRRVMAELVSLGDVVDVGGRGPIELGPVLEAAVEADVLVAVLTDEELHWLGDPDAVPQAFLDAPRLARLGAAEQRVALETALWIMTARGEFGWRGGPSEAYGVHAIVGNLRRAAPSVAIVRTDRRGQGTRLSARYEAGTDLLLVEDVDDTGLHRFVFRSIARDAAALTAALDPQRRATATAPPQTGRTTADLDPHPDDLARTCEASSLLYHAHLTSPEHMSARALTVYSAAQGVWALAGRHRTDDQPGQVAWQQLDAPALSALLQNFLRHDLG